MPYIHKIFEKATIRSVVDYLLFGLGPDEDTRDYEERLDELYNKFEEAVRKYDSNGLTFWKRWFCGCMRTWLPDVSAKRTSIC